MMGSREKACMIFLKGNRDRSTTRAKASPRAVESSPTVPAMSMLFFRILMVEG